ncbi:MAG: MotA/TolQ/ExbB proton channel family protein [Pseudomonadota bacterium]
MLRASIIVGLIAFGFFLAAERGVLQLALDSDRSYLSYVILAIYLLASAHWLLLAVTLAKDRAQLVELAGTIDSGGTLEAVRFHNGEGLVPALVRNLRQKRGSDNSVLVEALGDEIANRHAFGHFLGDALLRLGLLGTIIGFIFMLLPIAEMEGFDAGMMQQLLTAMSGGMAVALYTTLAGLVTSTLLKLQYHLLDAHAAALVTQLTILLDVHGDSGVAPELDPATAA